MRTSIVFAVAGLFLVTAAQAQDTPTSPQMPDSLVDMAAEDANGYVLFLQQFLASRGEYAGPLHGMLTRQTIGSLNGFCRSAGIADICARGPLRPDVVATLQSAITTELANPGTATTEAAEPVPAGELPPAAPLGADAQAVPLPAGWEFRESGGTGATGIEARVISAGANEATIHFVGTATRQGFINVLTGEDQPAGAGRWVAELSGRQERPSPSDEGTVYLQTAMFQDTAYLGELFKGVPLSDASDERLVSGSGEPRPEATLLTPYVQLPLQPGQQVNLVVHLTDPSFGPAP